MVTLKLQGRTNEGKLTGISTEIEVIDGRHAEDTLCRFHGLENGLREVGYSREEIQDEIRSRRAIAAGSAVVA